VARVPAGARLARRFPVVVSPRADAGRTRRSRLKSLEYIPIASHPQARAMPLARGCAAAHARGAGKLAPERAVVPLLAPFLAGGRDVLRERCSAAPGGRTGGRLPDADQRDSVQIL
jgi:hypothetical protein